MLRDRLGGRLGLGRRRAAGRSSRNGGRSAGTPRTDQVSRHARPRIAHFHLGAAALTADVEIDVGHARRFYNIASVIPAIVLAAGRSSRMGRAKATLPLDGGDTFLTRIVRTFLAAGVDDVVVVVGHEAEAIVEQRLPRAACRARFVANPDYDRGQLSSLLAGLDGRRSARRRGRAGHARRCAARVAGNGARRPRPLSTDARAGRAADLGRSARPSAAHRSLAVRRAARRRS